MRISAARCGVWPDQDTGVIGNWLIEPARPCPGCHGRVEFMRVRAGFDAIELLTVHQSGFRPD